MPNRPGAHLGYPGFGPWEDRANKPTIEFELLPDVRRGEIRLAAEVALEIMERGAQFEPEVVARAFATLRIAAFG